MVNRLGFPTRSLGRPFIQAQSGFSGRRENGGGLADALKMIEQRPQRLRLARARPSGYAIKAPPQYAFDELTALGLKRGYVEPLDLGSKVCRLLVQMRGDPIDICSSVRSCQTGSDVTIDYLLCLLCLVEIEKMLATYFAIKNAMSKVRPRVRRKELIWV